MNIYNSIDLTGFHKLMVLCSSSITHGRTGLGTGAILPVARPETHASCPDGSFTGLKGMAIAQLQTHRLIG